MAQKRNQTYRVHIPSEAFSTRTALHHQTDAVIVSTNNSNSKVNSATNVKNTNGFLLPELLQSSEFSTPRCHGDCISNTTDSHEHIWGPYFKSRANFVDLHVS